MALNEVMVSLCLCISFWFLSHGRSWPLPESGGPFIDQVYVLQSYAEGWKEGTWEEKVDERPCLAPLLYSPDKHEYYRCGRRGGLGGAAGARAAVRLHGVVWSPRLVALRRPPRGGAVDKAPE